MSKLIPKFLNGDKFYLLRKTMSKPSLANAPILTGYSYPKDKDNGDIIWVSHEDLKNYVKTALQYYNQNPTDANLDTLNNYKKAYNMGGWVPFGWACINSAMHSYGHDLKKQYWSNVAFLKDANKNFTYVDKVTPPSGVKFNYFDAMDKWSEMMDRLDKERMVDSKSEKSFVFPHYKVNTVARYLDYPFIELPAFFSNNKDKTILLNGFLYNTPEGVPVAGEIIHKEKKDKGWLDDYYKSGHDMLLWLSSTRKRLSVLNAASVMDQINHKALFGDFILFNVDGTPHHATIYSGGDKDQYVKLYLSHGVPGMDMDNKTYKNNDLYLDPDNETLTIWRMK